MKAAQIEDCSNVTQSYLSIPICEYFHNNMSGFNFVNIMDIQNVKLALLRLHVEYQCISCTSLFRFLLLNNEYLLLIRAVKLDEKLHSNFLLKYKNLHYIRF